MKKLLIIFLILFFVSTFFISYAFSEPIKIVTTLRLLKDITKNIGQDKVSVINILKGTENPHTYETKPKDIKALYDASIFIEIGGGLEGFADKLVKNSDKKNLKILVLIKGFHIINNNPHIWLDPENGKIIAEKIEKILEETDPNNKNYFRGNLKIYLDKIDKKEQEIKLKLSHIKNKKVISDVSAFFYFYQRFGFKEKGRIIELPGHEPSIRHIRDLIVKIKKDKIPYLISTPIFNIRAVNIIKEETHIKIVRLLPLLYDPYGIDSYLKLISYNGSVFENE